MPPIPRLFVLGALFLAGCRLGEAGPRVGPALTGDPARGFVLVREFGCTSCHASDALAAEPAPRLEGIGARLTPGGIGSALSGGARMPDCLASLAKRERTAAREALTHYLASLGGPLAPEPLLVDAQAVERGRQLYHSIACVACHAPFEEVATLARPLWDFDESFEPSPERPADSAPRDPLALRGLAERTSLSALARTLEDPLAVHPSGRMPSLGLDAREAHDVAAYLLYEDELARGGVRFAHGAGLELEVFEGDFPDEEVDFDVLEPVRTETVTSFFEGIPHREDDFAFRFRGFLQATEAGEHWFYTRSDDGSMLSVDGRLVVDNHGQHGMHEQFGRIQLTRGYHALEVTYFEHLGDEGLEVAWIGPKTSKGPIPFERLSHLVVGFTARPAPPTFALDARLVERGRALHAELGCASCHGSGPARAAPLAELDPRRGCLASVPGGTAPRYRFAPGERADLVAAVRAGTPPSRTAAERLDAELARLNCGACHVRGALAGPNDERRPFFQVASGLDLGDQGRFPPLLERAGAKLKPAWFQAVLESGGRARPYMKTRMPQFGAANVGALPELFAAADASLRDEREPEFTSEAVEAGKQLAGIRGLGCIQCHEFAGHPSIGIPAVDLARVHERVYPGWFRELLMDPVAIGMNTRMPSFWVEGKSPVEGVLDGDPARQVDALWTYLSLGSSMPLPEGLVPREGEYEVEVTDTPVCVGVFMKGASPRTLAVGLPERVHYAFDVQNSRLVCAWRGRFLDATGTWRGRAGELERPAGEDVLEFAPGCALMMLDAPDDPWPSELGREAGYRNRGRRFDPARRPVFAYGVCGVEVEESLEPLIRPGGATLVRRFHLTAAPELFLRVAVGESVERSEDGQWRIDGRLRVRVPETAFVVHGASGAELRVPSANDLEVEYSW